MASTRFLPVELGVLSPVVKFVPNFRVALRKEIGYQELLTFLVFRS